MKWDLLKINELVEIDEASLQTGPFGTQLKASEYVKEGVPVINVRNIGYGSVIEDKLEYVNNTTAERLGVHALRQNDIVFGRKGAVDRHALIDQKYQGWIQGSDCLRLRLKAPNIHNKFVSYYFCTKAHKEWMEAQGSFGATMNSLNQDIIKRISLPLPSLPIQKKIAAILSAYDDLIENNQCRIAILEKMAEEIYREWFVRMRFPGYGKVKYLKGIPEGWKRETINQIYKTTSGGTPSRKNSEFFKGEFNWVKTGELLDTYIFDTEEKITAQAIENSSAKIFPENTVIMAMYGGMSDESKKSTLGQLGILTTPSTTNQACCGFLPKETYMSEFFTLYLLKSYRNEFINISFGAAQQNISQTVINNFKVLIPNKDLIISFSKTVELIFREIKNMSRINHNLKKTRDLLLARLLSGKLSVENLDIHFPKSMEDDYAELHQ